MLFSRKTNIGILSAAMWIAALGSAPSVGSADESTDMRRARLEKMSSLEKDELLRNHKRLEQLKPEQQTQLRDLEQQLAIDLQGDRLRKVMLQYHEWLRRLPDAERADLLSLKSDDEKIARIKLMLEKQESDRLRELAKASLSREDVEKVRAWFGELVLRKKSELIQHLPEQSREKLIETEEPRRLVIELSNQFRDKNKPPPLIRIMELLKIDEKERLQLVGTLSSQAADVYRRASEQDKQTVLQNWVYATMSRPRMPSTDELRDLLNRLPPEERDRIENLPPEQMKGELTRHFFLDRMRRGNPDGKRPIPGDGFKPKAIEK